MMMKNLRRLAVTTVMCATSVAAVGVGTAGAGEITGNGNYKPVKAQSICAYSGQNDGFHDLAHAESPADALSRVQSYGQIIRTGETLPSFLRPGSACNGRSGFLASAP